MFLLFNRKKRLEVDRIREEEVQAIRSETLDKIDEATKSVAKVNRLYAKSDIKTYTQLIYAITGGDKR